VSGRHPPAGTDEEDETVTRSLLTIVQPGGDTLPEPDVLDRIMRDVHAVDAEMRAAGVWVFAGGLHAPSTATVVRAVGDDVLITDGPFAEGKEHMGGVAVVEAPDLDAALDWGRKLSAASTLPVEVRPFQG
jgi:hypothetical protein